MKCLKKKKYLKFQHAWYSKETIDDKVISGSKPRFDLKVQINTSEVKYIDDCGELILGTGRHLRNTMCEGYQTESPKENNSKGRSISETARRGSDFKRRSVNTSVVKDFTFALANPCPSRSN